MASLARDKAALSFLILVLGAGLATAAGATSNARAVKDGGTLQIALRRVGSLDPALAYDAGSWLLLEATCAHLMSYPDKPAPAGLRIVPEVATAYPKVSNGGREFTFTLRRDFKFSDGTRVTAAGFAREINRLLSPALESPAVAAGYVTDIVGADAVLAGKAESASGVVARGDRLIVRFTKPVRDFPARTAMHFFCAVPPSLPVDPEGVGVIPAAGPYHVTSWVRGRSITIERNRFYRRDRPHHVDRIVVDLTINDRDELLNRVEAGTFDWTYVFSSIYFDRFEDLKRKYGINRSRFFVKPGLTLEGFVLNTSQRLFHNNPRLRRAVSYAVDRRALLRAEDAHAGTLTDAYLPLAFPGSQGARVYPLKGPALRRAGLLAKGHRRGGKAVLWVPQDVPGPVAQAQILKANLERIGITVEINQFPRAAFFESVGIRGEPFDIAWWNWAPDYVDPYAYINVLFDGRLIRDRDNTNTSYFNSPTYNQLMDGASRKQGRARYRAYGRVAAKLARDAAPYVAYAFGNAPTLVSGRVGCIVLRPYLDLAAACLRR